MLRVSNNISNDVTLLVEYIFCDCAYAIKKLFNLFNNISFEIMQRMHVHHFFKIKLTNNLSNDSQSYLAKINK